MWVFLRVLFSSHWISCGWFGREEVRWNKREKRQKRRRRAERREKVGGLEESLWFVFLFFFLFIYVTCFTSNQYSLKINIWSRSKYYWINGLYLVCGYCTKKTRGTIKWPLLNMANQKLILNFIFVNYDLIVTWTRC